MSIFEKWFGGGEEAKQNKGEENVLESKKEGFSFGALTRAMNAFIANYQIRVGEEFIEAVINEAKLSEQEISDMVLASNNAMPENGLSVTANMAYLDGIREKIVNAIKKMDVGEMVE